MLRADIGMVHPAGFVHRQFDDFLGAGSQTDFALGRLLSPADNKLHGGTDFVQVDVEAGENPGGDPFGFPDQAKEDVFSADVVMVEPLGFLLGQGQNPAGPFGEFLEPASHNAAPVGQGGAALGLSRARIPLVCLGGPIALTAIVAGQIIGHWV